MSDLPKRWGTSSLGEVCDQPVQRIPDTDEDFTYIDIASIDRERKIISEPQKLSGAEAPSRARKVVHKGDVLVSMTRPNLNAVALVSEEHNECIASTGFDVLKPIEVEPRWIFAAVRSARFIDAMCEKVQGALYPAVKSADIREYEIPLPPLAEQTRIAAKLDELLAQVDALKARVDSIPALLKRFRQSVLAAAASGRLTEEWRDINQHAHDAAEAALGRFAVIEHDEKYHAPSEWVWLRIGQVSKLINGDRGKNYPSKSELVESGVPFINAGHIDEGCRLSSSKMNYISRAKLESLASGKISPGDILFLFAWHGRQSLTC